MGELMDLINKATLNIEPKYITKYTELISDEKGYKCFISGLSYELLNKINLSDAVEYNIEQLLQNVSRSRRRTKKRWLEAEFKSNSSLIETVQLAAAATLNRDIAIFKLTYKVNTLDELKKQMSKEQQYTDDKIISWSKDDSSYFVDFEHLKSKTRKQLIPAFQSDIKLDIVKYLKNYLYLDIGISMPVVMSDIPIDIGGRRKVSLSDAKSVTLNVNNKEVLYYLDVEEYNDTQINTYIDLKYVKKYCLDNAFKHINAVDKKIFSYILSKRKSNFFETRIITVDLVDIVKYIFASAGAKNYDIVRESIDKMKLIDVQIVVDGKSGVLSNIFTEVRYDEIKVGKTIRFGNTPTITISSLIVDELIEAQTIIIYGEKVADISPEAFSLVCALQCRRMRRYAENHNLIEDILHYSFFQVSFRLTD
ncbi:hypothetical protein, partial [Clostridium sp.]|uniref:hypothetical protein n=1 Tax=Clostridium sp. TaxID=1506 RepID=UPI003EEFEA8F